MYNWTLDLVNGSITAEVFGPVQPDHVAVTAATTLPGSCKEGVEPCVPRRDFRLINGDTEWNPCPYIKGEDPFFWGGRQRRWQTEVGRMNGRGRSLRSARERGGFG